MFLRLPENAFFSQHMVISADPQSHRAVFHVVDLRIGNREEIQVNDIVKCPHSTSCNLLYLLSVIHIDPSQGKTCQITHYKFPGTCYRHNHCLPIHGLGSLLHLFNGTHILGDLCAEVAAVDHSPVAVWICLIHRISVESKRCSCLSSTSDHQSDQFLYGDHPFFDPAVSHAFHVLSLPFRAKRVFQRISFHCKDFMGTHEIPVPLNVLLCCPPEQIRIADCRKYVVCFHPVIPVICAQIQKLREIPVPGVQVHCHCSLSDT